LKIFSEKENPEKKHSESESEEDDNTTEEMRQERRFRKRKAQPGWGRQVCFFLSIIIHLFKYI